MKNEDPDFIRYVKEIQDKAAERGLTKEELNDILSKPAKVYSYIATIEADRIWDERGLTNEDMDKWLKEKF
jgi:hypothetical protein